MNHFKLSKISACIALCLLSNFMVLSAEETDAETNEGNSDAEDDQVIVITSQFQRSVKNSISQKQFADTQIEAIGLEDIGVLPAKSIAEAITTLPGVAGGRSDDGTISQLSVRGTTDLTLGTLNGREQVTVGSTRNVEYALYPPNVMKSVQIHKSSKASLTEGGVSGVINMDTIKPLDYEQREVVFSGELTFPGIADDVPADDTGGTVSVLFIDQTSDDFGYALSFSHASDVLGRDGDVNPFDWRSFSGGFGSAPPDIDGDGETGDEVAPAGFNIGTSYGEEKRTSFFAALQWSVDNYEVNFDILKSDRKQDFLGHFMNFIGTQGAGGTVTNATFVPSSSGDQVASATITIPGTNGTGFGSGGSSQSNQFSMSEDDVLSTGLNITYTDEDWVISGDLSLSKAEQSSSFKDSSTQLAPTGGFGGPTFTLTYDALGPNPTLSVAEDMLNPALWVPRQYDENSRTFEDELVGLKFDFSRSLYLGDESFELNRLNFGFRISERTKTFNVQGNRFNTALTPDIDSTSMTIPVLDDSYVLGTVTPNNGPEFLLWDPEALLDRFLDMNPEIDTLNPLLSLNMRLLESGSVEEDNKSIYVQLDFVGELGVPYSGNIGVRYAETDLVAPGWTTPDTANVEATAIAPTHSYSEVLPSLNLSFDLAADMKLRFGAAKVMNRAPLDDLKSSQTIFISGFGANGSAGNPKLNPTTAFQTTLSFEWYPNEVSSIVLAHHYSSLDTFIGTEFETIVVITADSVDGFGNPVPGGPVDVELETVGNGEGGFIRGLEFAVNTDFSFIHESLNVVGSSFNYAYTESNVIPVGRPELGGAVGSEGAGLTGLSEDVANMSLWWADNDLEARIGVDYRSEYIEPSVFGNFQNVDETTLVSFNLGYDYSENFRISLFGFNITDEQRRKYTGNISERTEFNSYYGRTYGVNFYYKM